MIDLNIEFPIADLVLKYGASPEVEYEANEVVKFGTKRKGRTEAQMYSDALVGLAVQYAVIEHLQTLGYDVRKAPPNDLHYDCIITVDGSPILVDIKVRLDGKFWQQTPWESAVCKQYGVNVLLLCIDFFEVGNRFVHKGQAWSNNLESSQYGSPYVKYFEQVI